MLAVHAFLHVRAGHVVEHQRGRQRFQERTHLVEIGVLEIDHDVPAELGDARGDPLHHVLRRGIDQPLDEVEAHALHAGVVQLLQARVGESPRRRRPRPWPCRWKSTSASTSARLSVSWQVACTITFLSKPRKSRRCEQLLLRRVAGRVLALRRERKLRLRPEHVAVRVDRARPAACTSASTDWDGTECSRHSSAREFSLITVS